MTGKLAAVLVILLAYYGNLLGYRHLHPAGDPDRYFHYAIDRETVQHGIVHELPQVEDLGWGAYFPDKAFLFHALTSLGYAVRGETGANDVNYLFGAGTFVLLLLFGAVQIGWLRATLLVLALGLANPYFSPRMTFFRAHVSAIFFLTVFMAGLSLPPPGPGQKSYQKSYRHWLVAVSAALFALTYHAFYIPLMVLAIAWAIQRFERRLVFFALAGLVIGYVATPYFPGNLVAAIEQLRIALFYSKLEPGVTPGGEILPLRWTNFLIAFGPDLLLLVFAVFVVGRSRREGDQPHGQPRAAAYLLSTAAFFWILAARTPRASEYAIPATILGVSWALQLEEAGAFRRRSLAVLTIATVLPLLYYATLLAKSRPDLQHLAYNDSIFEALAAVPLANSSEKVFTCDWTFGAYVLYARPDLRFIDALDPRSLQFLNEPKFELVRDLKLGKIADAASVVAAFHARYLLCDEPALNQLADHDPRFKRLYAAPRRDLDGLPFRSSVMLFQLLP